MLVDRVADCGIEEAHRAEQYQRGGQNSEQRFQLFHRLILLAVLLASLDDKEHHAAENERCRARDVEIHHIAAGLRYDQLGIGHGHGRGSICGSVLHPCAVADGGAIGRGDGDGNHLAVNVVARGRLRLNNVIGAALELDMANARAKGRKIGRPQVTADDIPAAFLRHYPAYKIGKMNLSELARICGLSRTTAYKYIGLLEGE